MLHLTKLLVSQNEIRHKTAYLLNMVECVRVGRVFDKKTLNAHTELFQDRPNPPLISINRFPDGVLMIHDGHNRAVACCLGGRDYFDDSEYFIKDYTYEDYMALEPQHDWFTPFDPRIEVRQAEFGKYKELARRIYRKRPELLVDFVSRFRYCYCLPREIRSVKELSQRVKSRLVLQGRMDAYSTDQTGSDQARSDLRKLFNPSP
jgi:hypothetical protein